MKITTGLIARVFILAGMIVLLQGGTCGTEISVNYDESPPRWSWSYPKQGSVGNTNAGVLIKLNKNSRVYYAVFSNSVTPPDPQSLKSFAVSNSCQTGQFIVKADIVTNLELINLTIASSYEVYVTAEDMLGALQTNASRVEVRTTYLMTNNSSTAKDWIQRLVLENDNFIAAGIDTTPGNAQWRLVKRAKVDGSLIAAFGDNGIVDSNPGSGDDYLYDIASDGSYLYLVGSDETPGNSQWRIEKRDITSGALVSAFDSDGVVQLNPGTDVDFAVAVVVDGSGLYVAGFDRSSGVYVRLEKRNKTTGVLDGGFGSGGAETLAGDGSQISLAQDSSYLYIAQSDKIQKRDKSNGTKVSAFNGDGEVTAPAGVQGLLVDGSYLYAFSDTAVFKYDVGNGTLVSAFGGSGEINVGTPYSVKLKAIAVDTTWLYMAGNDNENNNEQWRIEKRLKSDGTLVTNFSSSGVLQENPSANWDEVRALVVDDTYIYCAGFDETSSYNQDRQWRLERRNKTTGLY